MKKVTITVYEFSELSNEAKEVAKDKHAEISGYSWSEEALNSLKKLAEHFGGKLVDYQVSWNNSSRSYALFDAPEYTEEQLESLIEELGAVDPKTNKGTGECVLTGYCMDDSAADGVREAFNNGERDTNKLLQAGFRSWLKDCQDDYQSQYSDEGFTEIAEANEWFFTKDGKIFNEKSY